MSAGKPCQFQSNAESQTEMVLILAGGIGTVKIFKNMLFLFVGNSGTMVDDRTGKRMLLDSCLQNKGAFGWGIGNPVVQKNGQNMGNTFAITIDCRKRIFR